MESDKSEGKELDKTAELELKNLINSLKGRFSFCNWKVLDEKITGKTRPSSLFLSSIHPTPLFPTIQSSHPPILFTLSPTYLPYPSPLQTFLLFTPSPFSFPPTPLFFSFSSSFFINPPNLLFDPPHVFLDLYPHSTLHQTLNPPVSFSLSLILY